MTTLADIAARHVPHRELGTCLACYQTWPCDAARLAALLTETLTRERECSGAPHHFGGCGCRCHQTGLAALTSEEPTDG